MFNSPQKRVIRDALPNWKPHKDYGIVRISTIPGDALRKPFSIIIEKSLHIKLTKGLWLLGRNAGEMVLEVEIGLHSRDMGLLFKAANAVNAEFRRFKT